MFRSHLVSHKCCFIFILCNLKIIFNRNIRKIKNLLISTISKQLNENVAQLETFDLVIQPSIFPLIDLYSCVHRIYVIRSLITILRDFKKKKTRFLFML